MKRKLSTLVIALCLSGTVVFGQSIQNSVVASTGASTSSGNVKMDYTLGEVVVETFSAGGNTLTQGFHQTNLTLVAIENTELFSEISIFPNPASELVNIDMTSAGQAFDIIMYDVTGKLISSKYEAKGQCSLDVKPMASGTYYLQIINRADNTFKTFKLVKTNN